jgi:tRNA(fMet)-specific endonuclease VapC
MVAKRRYMLDTHIASFAIRGANSALQARLRAHPAAELTVSTITEGELLTGLAKLPQAVALKVAVHEFLQLVDVIAWDRKAAAAYGTLRAELERRGTPLGNLDMLIAAHAIATGSVLVTNDKALLHTPGLQVEDWSA